MQLVYGEARSYPKIDCTITNVPIGVLTNALNNAPAIVLDNLAISNVHSIVQVDDGSPPLLTGKPHVLLTLFLNPSSSLLISFSVAVSLLR